MERTILKIVTLIILFFTHIQSALAEIECDYTVNEQEYREYEEPKLTIAPDFFKINPPLFSGGKVKCEYYHIYGDRFQLTKVENGIYKGVKYWISLSDSTGRVQGVADSQVDDIMSVEDWAISCKIDEMDDTHFCSISKDTQNPLRIVLWKDGSLKVLVGNENFPGTKAMARVDKNQPFNSMTEQSFSDEDSEILISQMLAGETILTRYQEWPNKVSINKRHDLFGFNEALEILKLVYSKIP